MVWCLVIAKLAIKFPKCNFSLFQRFTVFMGFIWLVVPDLFYF